MNLYAVVVVCIDMHVYDREDVCTPYGATNLYASVCGVYGGSISMHVYVAGMNLTYARICTCTCMRENDCKGH